MVTVARQLDAPIKLQFSTSAGSNMLGLGDIIVPGVFIALALRFDLWMFYRTKVTRVETKLESEYVDVSPTRRTSSNTADTVIPYTNTTTQVETQYRSVKATFIDPRGRWGDRLWTTSLRRLFASPTATPGLRATAFPKTYFYSTILGYVLGLLATLVALLITQHLSLIHI